MYSLSERQYWSSSVPCKSYSSVTIPCCLRVGPCKAYLSMNANPCDGKATCAPEPFVAQRPLGRNIDIAKVQAAVRIPPGDEQLSARVEHLAVEAPGPLSHVIAAALQLPVDLIQQLMRFGAVYYCPVPPDVHAKGSAALPAETVARMEELRAQALLKWGRDSRLSTPRRALVDCVATVGGYVRVHLHPKRWVSCPPSRWSQRGDWRGLHSRTTPRNAST